MKKINLVSKITLPWVLLFMAGFLGVLGLGLLMISKNFVLGWPLVLFFLTSILTLVFEKSKVIKIASTVVVYFFFFAVIALIRSGCFRL